jgi:FAD/FMN-containing dehydrogenase
MNGFVADPDIVSWGRVLRGCHLVARPAFRDELDALVTTGARETNGLLPVGLRRSYGETCLNADGALIEASRLDRFISFDPATGLLHAEAGLSLAKLLEFAIPRGFFLPVTPGTKFVTLGGAVANDVHGKNHWRNGTFGRWVRHMGLLRSDGSHHRLAPGENTELFAATVGGLGLTGLITDVAVQLLRIRSSDMDTEKIAFGNIAEFFELTAESLDGFEHTVAWVDCLAAGDRLGRGILTRSNHAETGALRVENSNGPSMPADLPEFVLNRYSIRLFNTLYFYGGRMRAGRQRQSCGGFFYPLDGISNWNRMYGARGMFQYQSVVPPASASAATKEMVKQISAAGQGSFLAVLKTFGALESPGLLSFPMKGTTLALDFPNRGRATLELFDRLDAVVKEAGGRLYAAKDGRIPKKMFVNGFPALGEFARHVDPAFSSSFWRRVTG